MRGTAQGTRSTVRTVYVKTGLDPRTAEASHPQGGKEGKRDDEKGGAAHLRVHVGEQRAQLRELY